MQFNPKKGMFTYVYGFGDDIVEDVVPMDSPILGCFSLFPEGLQQVESVSVRKHDVQQDAVI